MRIPAELQKKMLSHVLGCLPEEACGLLGGWPDEAAKVIAVENELHSPVRFRMKPLEQLHALLEIEAGGMEVVGIYHSHPGGPPVPSPTDIAEFSYPGALTLIWAPAGEGWELRAYRIEGNQASPVEIEA